MKFLFLFLILSSFAATALSQENADLKKLVETERAFARMASEKSTKEAFLHFLADDGIVFEPTAVNAKEVWSKRPESAGLLSWQPVWADISADGTIGYTTGPWEFRPKGKDGEAVAFGQYVTIWKKQKDGEYRAVLDIGISHGKPEGKTPKLGFPKDAGNGESNRPRGLPARRDLASFPSEDVRVYRDGSFPILGASNALKTLDEFSNEKRRWIEDSPGIGIYGMGDLAYDFGVFRVETQKGEESWNYLKIFKYRNAEWLLVIDVMTVLPN